MYYSFNCTSSSSGGLDFTCWKRLPLNYSESSNLLNLFEYFKHFKIYSETVKWIKILKRNNATTPTSMFIIRKNKSKHRFQKQHPGYTKKAPGTVDKLGLD